MLEYLLLPNNFSLQLQCHATKDGSTSTNRIRSNVRPANIEVNQKRDIEEMSKYHEDLSYPPEQKTMSNNLLVEEINTNEPITNAVRNSH